MSENTVSENRSENKTFLNYKIDTSDGKTYAGTKVFVRNGVVWILSPHVQRKAEGSTFEPLKVFRLGIPLQKVEQIRQEEKSQKREQFSEKKEEW